MPVLIVSDPAVLTVAAPDGTPVAATMSEGDPMYSTVYSTQALFYGGVGRTILTITVGDPEEEGSDSYMNEDYAEAPVEGQTDLNYSPVTPSDPFVESRAGAVAVTWDGLGSGGESMPVNLYRVEVHRSIEGIDFATDPTTYAATMYIAGTHVFTDQEFGVQWWYKLVSLDQTGRRSTDSAGLPGTAMKIVGADIAANTITANNIQANSITTVELTATAIDGMTITGATIRTVASGARWEMGTTGPSYALSNRLLGYTGHVLEKTPALIESSANSSAGGVQAGLRLNSPDITPNPSSDVATIELESVDPTVGSNLSRITISASEILLIGDTKTQFNGDVTALANYDGKGSLMAGDITQVAQAVIRNRKWNSTDGASYQSDMYIYNGSTSGITIRLSRDPAGGTAVSEVARMELDINGYLRLDTPSTAPYYVPKVAQGSFARGILTSGSGATQSISFPTGLFNSAPHVFAFCDSSRLNFAAGSVTTTGADIRMDNWSPASSAATTVYWTAIQEI